MAESSIAYEQPPGTISTSLAPTAAAQLRIWVQSQAGQLAWDRAGTLTSLELICHALDTTHAPVYGLLISPIFFTIFSVFPQQAFAHLAQRYQTAARVGLCFWWDGVTLLPCEHRETFFALLRTLPAP